MPGRKLINGVSEENEWKTKEQVIGETLGVEEGKTDGILIKALKITIVLFLGVGRLLEEIPLMIKGLVHERCA